MTMWRSSFAPAAYSDRSFAYSMAAGTLWTEHGLNIWGISDRHIEYSYLIAYPTTTMIRSSSPLRMFSVARRPSRTVCAACRELSSLEVSTYGVYETKRIKLTEVDPPEESEEESMVV